MKRFAKVISIMLVAIMAFTSVAMAAAGDTCIAVGKDLDETGLATVKGFFGISNLDDYKVIEISNKDEHKYLKDYVDEEKIGTEALSSVMITETDDEDIDVEIHNINYCTEDMYENALETAGVTGADVVVAAPYPISGTAALVGTIKAYEKMTGHKVHDDVIEAAVEELTTTGDIGTEVGNKDAITDIIADLKDELAANPDMSEDDIIATIKSLASKYGVSLTDAQIDKIKAMFKKFKGLDINWGGLADKAKDLADQAAQSGLLDRFINWIKSLF